MKKIKSFFKKHYKRFVTISVTACLCFCFLFSSVFAYDYNKNFEIRYMDLDYITLYQVASTSGPETGIVMDWEITEPPSADGFAYGAWSVNKKFDIKIGTNLNLWFTNSQRFVIPDSVFRVEIPFAFCFVTSDLEKLSQVSSCVLRFNYTDSKGVWNGISSLTQVSLSAVKTLNPEVSALKGVATFNLPLSNAYIFPEFSFDFSDFNGSLSGLRFYAFSFTGPIKLVHSYSLTEQETINKGLSDESDVIRDATSFVADSSITILHDTIAKIPSQIKTSLMAVRAIWLNLFSKIPFVSPLVHFSVALGIFGFVVGMGSIVVGAVSRSNSRRERRDYYKSHKGGK